MNRRWYLGHALFLAFSATILLLTFENSDLDLRLARPFYDSALGDFPLRQNGLFAPVFYYGVKYAVLAARIRRKASMPPMPGIMTSSTTTENRPDKAPLTPDSPSGTVSTAKPSRTR